VTAVFGTGANDVIAVKGASGEILIPLLPEVILSVDVAGGAMVVDPPPGLPGMPEGA
jgi:ribosomal 30S subunit maturation factor RimM